MLIPPNKSVFRADKILKRTHNLGIYAELIKLLIIYH